MRALSQKLTVTGLFLIYSYLLFGQWNQMDWADIPPEDLSMTVYPMDSSAKAVVLADCGRIRMIAGMGDNRTQYFLERHRRVKLLKRQSFDKYGRMKLFFVHRDDRESIDEFEAQTILPNGKVYRVAAKDVFKTKENEWLSSLSFAFPNLEEGAIVEFKYELASADVIEPRPWYFQEEIPVRFSSLVINNSSRISYVSLFNGGDHYPEKEEQGTVTIYRKGESSLHYGPELIMMKNAPALTEEEFITTLEDYRAKIRLQGEYYFTRDGHKENLFTSWEKSAQSLLSHPQFGQQFLKKRHFKKLLDEVKPLLSQEMGPEETMETIYKFVQENVAFDGKKSFWVPDNLNKAFVQKKGNAGEVNLMCLALLKANELEAFPVLTSTRDHGKMYRHYPLIDQFNYLIVGVKIGEKIILLDATDPMLTINMPSPMALNKYGWVVDKEHLSWIDIKVPLCRDIYGSELSIDQDGNIEGKMRAMFNSYTALVERKLHRADATGEYWKKRMEDFATDVELESVEAKYVGGKAGKFMNNIEFSVPNGAMVAGDFLYVSPIYYSNFLENPFQLKQREYPVDFPYPFEERYVVSVLVPDGYQVEELPKSTETSLPNNTGKFEYKTIQLENKVQVMLTLTLNETTFAPESYEGLKSMFEQMISKRSEQIVLKKISDK